MSRSAFDIVGERAIGQGFGEVQPADPVSAVEIRERAGDPQHPVIAARRQSHAFRGVVEQLQPLRIRLRDGFQRGRRSFGVGPDIRQSKRGIARRLNVACYGDTSADVRRALSCTTVSVMRPFFVTSVSLARSCSL